MGNYIMWAEKSQEGMERDGLISIIFGSASSVNFGPLTTSGICAMLWETIYPPGVSKSMVHYVSNGHHQNPGDGYPPRAGWAVTAATSVSPLVPMKPSC